MNLRTYLSLAAIILALGLALGSISLLYRGAKERLDGLLLGIDLPASTLPSTLYFRVEDGESASQIGRRLQEKGLVRSALLFRLLVAYYGVSSQLEAGDYELSAGMTTTQIIEKLHQGLVRSALFTIPEGWRMEEIAAALDQKGIFPSQSFLEASYEGGFPHDFLKQRPPGSTLEGYLFPDTYRISPAAKPVELIEMMLHNFQRRFTPEMREKAAAAGLTLHEVVTLASIVEREAVLPQERPLIASVYLNRLRFGMPLQADPTVQYALGSEPALVARWGYWKTSLETSDLEFRSPYNTYRRPGLPPGPISNPGLAAIQAVLEPAETSFLYFVARGDGSHAFAETLREHQQNIARYGGR